MSISYMPLSSFKEAHKCLIWISLVHILEKKIV